MDLSPAVEFFAIPSEVPQEPEQPHIRVRVGNGLARLTAIQALFDPIQVQCEPFCTIAQGAVGLLEHARERLKLAEELTGDNSPYDSFTGDVIDLKYKLRRVVELLEAVEEKQV